MALSPKNRLTKKTDFDAVFREGKTVRGSFLFIKARLNRTGVPRIGFLISKNLIPKAVARNRLKRVLGEAARVYIKNKKGESYDLAVVLKKKETEDALISDFTRGLSNL